MVVENVVGSGRKRRCQVTAHSTLAGKIEAVTRGDKERSGVVVNTGRIGFGTGEDDERNA